jgi:hypothetical protein
MLQALGRQWPQGKWLRTECGSEGDQHGGFGLSVP